MQSGEYQRQNENILVRLRRLLPGAAVGLKAMSDENGAVTSGVILKEHWGAVFHKGEIDEQLLQHWSQDGFPDGGRGQTVQGLPSHGSTSWRLRRTDVRDAIEQVGNAMPGPDNILPRVAEAGGSRR